MIFFMTLIFSSWCAVARAQQTVTLAWDADTSGSVLGYVVYVGPASQTYTSRIDVGTNTSFTINNLQPGTTNYFAVTAYTVQSESLPSGELAYIVPGILQLLSSTTALGSIAMRFPVAPNHWYEVQASSDLQTWRTIWQTAVMTSNCWVGFKDHRPMSNAQCQFYRLALH